MRNILIGLATTLLLSGCSWLITSPSRVENPIVEGVNYVGMTVRDLDRSEKLYSDAADVQVVQNGVIENHPLINELTQRADTSIKTRLMKSVNAQVLFMEFAQPSEAAKNTVPIKANGPGLAHLAFQVVDRTETYQQFLAGGAKHIGAKEMWKNPKTHVSYAYAFDLDDAIVEVEHVDVAALDLPKPPANDRRIRHISLATLDMPRLIDFYSILLETKDPRRWGRFFHNSGESLDKVSGLPDSETEMAWFQVRNLELEIIQYFNPEAKALNKPRPIDATGFNMIMFDVTNLTAAKAKFLEAGGTLVKEGQTFTDGETFFGRDPDGNLLGFQALPAASPFSAKNFKNNGMG
ncbi:VOC family protein [uncultured Paraglaciecola sp.]|mgnify:CR=1 FL=1|uniref:VOC family protein n=1 Tax=uncultured Paraglaciecola sp. TaxID=1765024 RepID=UPI00260ED737|nr:VOC family protein [uncultured Paraglaciecola sp.]